MTDKHLEKILLSRPWIGNEKTEITEKTQVAFNLSLLFFREIKGLVAKNIDLAFSPDGTDIYFDPVNFSDIIQSDGCICKKSQIDKKGVMGRPILVIEIDSQEKKDLYQSHGVSMYVNIDIQNKLVKAYKLENSAYNIVDGGFLGLGYAVKEEDIFSK